MLIAEALRMASELAGGRVEDEPAAMLASPCPCGGTRSRAAWTHFPIVYARNLAAKTLGARLDVELDDLDLGILRLRIVTGDATFDEVRTWFAAHLRPLKR